MSPPAVSAPPPQGVDPDCRFANRPTSPTSPAHPDSKGAIETPAPQATGRPKMEGPLAVKSKAAKPPAEPQVQAPEQGLIDALQSRLHTPPMPATGLLSIAAARPPTTGAANPQMPGATTENPSARTSTKEEVTTQEIYPQEADDQSGPVDADITHLAEQRAQLRHIGVLLRVTLYRRAAELNFRGVDFRHLPREVMRSICNDFNHIGGELARRLASLFAFLKPASGTDTHADRLGLSLYAEPAYWLYGLLSFCAKACESKIEEANGAPVLRAKDEGGAPDTEATGRTLALMQTVVMSFGRNQSLGKPDLPIHHLRVYFPVQLVHKLVERMKTDLQFTDATPEDDNKYKRNSESETNSPYIVVGTFQGLCPSNTFAGLPDTPSLEGAYEQGLLDGNLGQMASFQSTYKSTLSTTVARNTASGAAPQRLLEPIAEK